MKKLTLILLLSPLIFGCSTKPKFEVDTCFKDGFNILEIYNTTETHYQVRIHNFLKIEKQFEFEIFENDIKKSGLIPKPCDVYREKK